MKLFSLTVDFAFKSVFASNSDLLLALLNSFPQFSGDRQIESLDVLNPEIPKEMSSEKLSILDIRAKDKSGTQFIIEMQAFPQSSFPRRALYYWAKVYSRGLRKKEDYDGLKKVISINFLKHPLWKDKPEFLSTFRLLEQDRKFLLTDDLNICIIELSKFTKKMEELETGLDLWLYLLKRAGELQEGDMKTLEKKNSDVKKAISVLREISRKPKSRELYESRLKAELDYNTNMRGAYQKGIEEGVEKGRAAGLEEGIEKGIEKGIEQGVEKGLLLGIQMNLEIRFGSLDKALFQKIQSIKDGEMLRKILELSAKADSPKKISDFLSKVKKRRK